MIYITGDTHNSEDISNLSSKNMRLCCMEQGVDTHDITHAIVLAVMGNHDNYDIIEKLPEVEMFGTKTLKVSDNVAIFRTRVREDRFRPGKEC